MLTERHTVKLETPGLYLSTLHKNLRTTLHFTNRNLPCCLHWTRTLTPVNLCRSSHVNVTSTVRFNVILCISPSQCNIEMSIESKSRAPRVYITTLRWMDLVLGLWQSSQNAVQSIWRELECCNRLLVATLDY